MSDKLETKYYKLEKLVKWEHVEEVNEMLMNGISPHKVSDWCKEKGFSISHPKLYEYKDMLQTAITKQITVERLLGIGVPKRSPIKLASLGLTPIKDMVKNEMDVLDSIVQKGYEALLSSPTIKIQDALRAIELKNKLTEGKHAGLTGYGLDQLRALEQAKFQAMVSVVLKYVPEDKHPEIEEAIAQAERSFYENEAPDLLDQYEEQLELDRQANQDTIVSDTPF